MTDYELDPRRSVLVPLRWRVTRPVRRWPWALVLVVAINITLRWVQGW